MRTTAAIVGVVLGLAGSAHAADVGEAAPDWAGVYAGLNAGYGWGSATWTFPFAEFFGGPAESAATNPAGGLLGGHIGVNFQNGSWVAGLEASAALAGLTQTFNGTPFGFPGDTHTIKVKDLETVTGRLGYAMDTWLIYGKGGFGTGSVNLSSAGGGRTANVSKRLNGWTLGVGVETMMAPNVVVGVEYDYINLSGARFTTTDSGGGPYNVDISNMNIHAVLARVSWMLN
jgi:outer membrane immunogenic protein